MSFRFPTQNLPGITVIILAVAGIGALPYGVHRLYYGEHRKTQLDRFDFEMNKRDQRIKDAQKKNNNKTIAIKQEEEHAAAPH